MPKNLSETAGRTSLTDDERAIIELYRTLHLSRDEGLRRLATPASSPVLPQTQELQANMVAVAQDLLPPDSTADYPTRP